MSRPRAKFRKGQWVRDHNGRIRKIAEVSWCVGYSLEGDGPNDVFQEGELKAIRKRRKPRKKAA